MSALAEQLQGIGRGIPFAEYVRRPEVHATSLFHLLTSPRHYQARISGEQPDTDSLRQGRAGHTAILEPDRFLLEYAVWKADNGRRFGKKWDEFCAGNADKCILTQAQYEAALRMRDAVDEHPVARGLVRAKGESELTLRWAHPPTGIACKARIDRLTENLIDIKTTRNPDPHKFGTSAAQYGYAFQLAFYGDGVVAALGRTPPPTKIVAVQNAEPFDVVVFDLPPEVLAIGREQVERAMNLLAACKKSGQWPGMAPDTEVTLRLPAWAAPQEEDEEPLTFGGEAVF
jgi:hypothetical protein